MDLASEALFRRLAEHSLVGIYIIQDGRYAYANPTFADIFGFTREEILALDDWRLLIAHEDRARVAESVRQRLDGEAEVARYAFRGLRKDGSIIDVEVYGNRTEVAGRPAVLGNLIEVTERRRADEALREREELFRHAFDHTDVAMVLTDLDHRFVRVNDAFARLLGYAPDQMLGMTMAQVTHPDDLAESYARRETLLAGKANHFQMEKRYICKDRRVLTVLVNVSLVRDAAGRPEMYVGQVQDITERKRAEEEALDARAAAEQSLARLQAVVTSMADGLVVADPHGNLLDWNPAALRMLGFTSVEEVRRHLAEFRAIFALSAPGGTTIPFDEWPMARVVRGETLAGLELQVRRLDSGLEVFISFSGTPALDAAGRVELAVLTLHDVTERRRLEAQYRQAQKMEGVGQLAGGIAHDFNNLLTVINGYSEMLLDGTGLEPADRELIREVRRAGDRAASLTRQLLAFSRKQVLAPQVLDLNALIRETERMLRRLIGEDIGLAAALDPKLGRIKADPGQIEQVVMNLVVNARDAMPRGGKLTIETRNIVLDEEYARHHLHVAPGSFVLLAVTDTGVGMDEATMAHIFEPFFTTKGAGKGTGLGLSTVFGIVRQSGGFLEVYSELGKGTTFKVYLPRLLEEKGSAQAPSAILEVPRGTETVLLAEDDDGIRALARIALQSYGYTVLESGEGEEGLRIGLGHAEPIALLITDVVMPKMSGREMAERLKPVHPEMRVLYMSGYTDDAIVRHGIVDEGVAFLQKPFTPTTLARKVREVLDRAPTRFG